QRGLMFGWKASASLPLHKNDKVYAVINFYANTINAFDEAARELLTEMAMNIDYALNNFDTEIQRRQAEAELADSRNLLQTIIDTAPLSIYWKDRNLRYLGCNPAFAKDAGVASSDDLIGKDDSQLAWCAHAEHYHAADRQVMDSGHSDLFHEQPLITAEGDTIWLRISRVPLCNASGQTIGLLGIYQNITAIKKTQLALQHSEANLNQAQALAKIGSWRLEADQNSLEWSAETYRIFGLSPGETAMNYLAFLDHVHPNDRDLVDSAWQEALKGLPYHIEHRIVANGEIRWIEERAELEFDEAGNLIVGIGTVQDITERKHAQERIGILTNFDPLTGLPNRTQLDARVRYAVSMAKRNHSQLALMFLDLDHFKDINDTLGHSVGDKLLVELAKRMHETLRDEDTVARMGGDEFIILLPGVKERGAESVAQKLLDAISKPYPIEHYNLSLTASIGIALYPGDGEDLETLSRSADTAMYRAKQDGRHGYRFFTPEMQARSAHNLQLMHALRHALDLEQMQVYYQPQVSIADDRIIGVEALLRWQHPKLGMVSPGEFIPVAEDSGLILPIGEWVLRNAVRQVNTWREKGLASLIVAVNLSAVQFRHPDLPDLVTRILDDEGLPPEFLELELTEGVAMNNPEDAIAVINNLHERGIRMSIDDFGTGYSSLSYLKKFKVYKLKIDQSFVRDISTDPEDKAIVRAVISLAKSLGLKTIAEGVETVGQQAFLQEQGCDEMQGYLFSKPMPAEQFEILLKKGFSS
ncbi:MAG: bifunctional diguanylate cyclase/phosphodiesterase, partial [Methylomonas sp.]